MLSGVPGDCSTLRTGAGSHQSAGGGHVGAHSWDKVLGLGPMAPPELPINQNLHVNFSSTHKFFIYHY